MKFATEKETEQRLLFSNYGIFFVINQEVSLRGLAEICGRLSFFFHCSANKPSGWTKAARRRRSEHVRAASAAPALSASEPARASSLRRLECLEKSRAER